jgi:hypothetical protein
MSAQPQDPADFAIAADALALARRRIGLDPIAAGPDWTACPAPRVGAVVDADGSVRACEYGSAPLGSLVDHAVAEVREGAAFAKLRSALAGGRLPRQPARGRALPRSALNSAAKPAHEAQGDEAEQQRQDRRGCGAPIC